MKKKITFLKVMFALRILEKNDFPLDWIVDLYEKEITDIIYERTTMRIREKRGKQCPN